MKRYIAIFCKLLIIHTGFHSRRKSGRRGKLYLLLALISFEC